MAALHSIPSLPNPTLAALSFTSPPPKLFKSPHLTSRIRLPAVAPHLTPLRASSQPPIASTAPYLEPYPSCSMTGRHLKVAVLLSGGVDSSVALRLLHAADHSYTVFYLKIWFQEDFENFWSECPWDEDLKYVKAVCDQVDVPLEVVHLSDEYWKNMI